jgi:bifunctional DNA-binding transcriptional regulator/antitoxin component of YhaV-PrlF toxin-antitoxin module
MGVDLLRRKHGKYDSGDLMILKTSKVFQRGKTTIPVEIRKLLNVVDGDNVVWYYYDGKIFLDSAVNM